MDYNGVEKRRFVRANFPCKIIIHSPQEQVITTHTENIGAGGVRVIIDEKLEVFSQVTLRIFLEPEPIESKGRVVWVVERKSSAIDEIDRFDTGFEFFQIKDPDRKAINDLVERIISENNDSRKN
ncbi:MAG: PilZ domain-containing protein [Candidatus Omnitrophica bacterium]|nr:PilZ domain-containing protein [Candidatus Omnitrophota bacterium]